MFFKKKFDPSPRGVPLEHLESCLSRTTLKISRDADSLIAEHHAAVVTKLKVIAPARDEPSKDPLQAVVQITTDFPRNLKSFLTPESLTTLNQAAVFGALTLDNGRCFIGSRLSVFEQEEAWNLYIPFLLGAVISGKEYHADAILSTLGKKEAKGGDSAWTLEDFNYVQSKLSELCLCTANGGGLTAEFGLRSGAASAAFGDHMTALWQLKAKEPHPGAGGGLLCILHMPHRVTRERLPDILVDLNRKEMAPRDQPPHFGAWCQGNSEETVAYISFLPNFMHRTDGVALNVSIWAFHRAHWADAYLASIGVNENQPALGIGAISKTVKESKARCEKPVDTAGEDISKPSALSEQKDEREPFYSLAGLALQRAFTRSQQLAFQLRSLKAEDGKWLTLFNVWLECLLFDYALSDSNLAMRSKVHTLFVEAVAIGYTVESKFPIESFPEITNVIGQYLEQFGKRIIYDDTDAESWANSAVGFHILRVQEKLGLNPNNGDFEILSNDIRSHVFDTMRSHLYDDFLAQLAWPRVN